LKASQLVKIARHPFRTSTARVASSGAGSAFPSQTTYIARDDGLDGERIRTAEDQLRAWRGRGELPLPDFAEESRIAL
jgi:MscS family membrane protein